MSGGVDSAVTALLLQREWHEVSAGFMRNFVADDASCPTLQDQRDAYRVSQYLDLVDFHVFDFQKEYNEKIIQYIYDGYAQWRTPNPDVLCNSLVKFALFADKARQLGFDAIATGHYAIKTDDNRLFCGVDPTKDQSYFLAQLSAQQLSFARFPLGGLTKSQVRAIAREADLPNATRPDSQGLCFIGKVSMKDFLSDVLPPRQGDIVDIQTGKIVGQHDGVQFFTLGQRKGIGVGGGSPYYVVKKDVQKNTLYVGFENDPARDSYVIRTAPFHWIHDVSDSLDSLRSLWGIVRYHQTPQEVVSCTVLADGSLSCQFATPQKDVAPWQFFVLLHDTEVLGSAEIIESCQKVLT